MSEEFEEEVGKLPIMAADDSGGGGVGGRSQSTSNSSIPAITGFPLGHEGFVQPSSYLRRSRAYSRPMPPAKPVTAVDREQHKGLVSCLQC